MGRDLRGYGGTYPAIRWPNDARIAISLVAHFEEGAEPEPLEGADHLPPGASPSLGYYGILGAASMYEYGPRRGFWRLMEIFRRHQVKATFFACGMALERSPAAARKIAAQGHEVCGHGYWWRPSYEMSLEEERADIRRAVEAIEETTGQRPVGWNGRAPGVHTRELLVEHGGFIYDSDSYSDDLPYFVEVDGRRLLTVPYSLETNDEKFWPPPLVAGFTRPGHFFSTLKGTFDRLYAEGAFHPKMMSVGLHLRISGRPSRAGQVDRFIGYAKGFPGVWFARRVDIARWWLEHYGRQ